jgi:hypothetical protein
LGRCSRGAPGRTRSPARSVPARSGGIVKPEDPKQPKQPFYHRLPGGEPFAFAGLWTTATPKDAEEPIATVEKPKRRGPISEEHKQALREAQLRRWASEPRPSQLPVVLLRLELASARRAGAEFEEAWAPAVKAALRGVGKGSKEWREVLGQTQEAWRRAYELDEGQPCFSALESARI